MSATAQETKTSVTDYLAALAWDGTPRLDRWLVDLAGADDTAYVRSASRAMLVAAVRRARHPGCRFDQMPVLAGPQGSCKSSALRLLAVEDAWFTDLVPLTERDMRAVLEATAGKWIVEASELESLLGVKTLAEGDDDDEEADAGDEDDDEEDEGPSAAALKAFLSRTHDEARMAYARERSRVPRQFVVVGTTAAEPYLSDSSGNRRIWPIHVAKFDLERLKEIRDQLWAEAATAEAAGESIDLAMQTPSA
jgi:predicted P-loop ATPase